MNLPKLGLLAWILVLADTCAMLVLAIVNPYVLRTMRYWSGGGEPYYAIHPLIVATTALLPVLALAWVLCADKRSIVDWVFMLTVAIAVIAVWVWRYPPPPFLG